MSLLKKYTPPLLIISLFLTVNLSAAPDPVKPEKVEWSMEQRRLIAEINQMENDISIYQAGGAMSALVSGIGYVTWQLSSSMISQNIGLGLGVAGLLTHEGILHFGANDLHDQLISRRYILAANGAGHPALKAKPAMRDIGILSGTTRAYRTEYFFDGMFWASAFVAQATVASVKYLPSDSYSDNQKVLHSALAGIFAAISTYKFLHYFKWKSEMKSELERLETSAFLLPDASPGYSPMVKSELGLRFQFQTTKRF